jgi:hypothetical protein
MSGVAAQRTLRPAICNDLTASHTGRVRPKFAFSLTSDGVAWRINFGRQRRLVLLYSRELLEETMAELQLPLTTEERDFLAGLLEVALKETRIEEHRTRTLSYREIVVHKEDLIVSLLNKLKGPSQK